MISRLLHGAGHYKPTPPAPDGSILLFGDDHLGYYGRVRAASLITGDALASLCTLTAGIPIVGHSDTEWCKFAYKGKILFVAAHFLRHTISYSALYAKNLVDGRLVTIGGKQYKVRLLSGGDYAGESVNNEWDNLIYRIAPSAPVKVAGMQKWDTFTADDFLRVPGGSAEKGLSMCSNTYTYNTSGRVVRGNPTFGNYNFINQNDAYIFYAWRPVLELMS